MTMAGYRAARSGMWQGVVGGARSGVAWRPVLISCASPLEENQSFLARLQAVPYHASPLGKNQSLLALLQAVLYQDQAAGLTEALSKCAEIRPGPCASWRHTPDRAPRPCVWNSAPASQTWKSVSQLWQRRSSCWILKPGRYSGSRRG